MGTDPPSPLNNSFDQIVISGEFLNVQISNTLMVSMISIVIYMNYILVHLIVYQAII